MIRSGVAVMITALLAAAPALAGNWELKEAIFPDNTKKNLQKGEFGGGGDHYTVPDYDANHFTIKNEGELGVSLQRARWTVPATLSPGQPVGATVSVDCISWSPRPGRESYPGPSMTIATLNGVGGVAMAGSGDQGVCGKARSHTQTYDQVISPSSAGSDLVIHANALSSGTLGVDFVYKWVADGSSSQGPTVGSPVSGAWNSDSGLMVLSESGGRVTGTYDFEGGRIIDGRLAGTRMTGIWVQNKAQIRCNDSVDGSYFHGRFVFDFSGSSFVGKWSYCDEPMDRKWNGTKK